MSHLLAGNNILLTGRLYSIFRRKMHYLDICSLIIQNNDRKWCRYNIFIFCTVHCCKEFKGVALFCKRLLYHDLYARLQYCSVRCDFHDLCMHLQFKKITKNTRLQLEFRHSCNSVQNPFISPCIVNHIWTEPFRVM